MNKQVIVALMIATGLVGCATQRPLMPDDNYAKFVTRVMGLQDCSMRGHISQDVAALGIAQEKSKFNTWSYSTERLEAEVAYQKTRVFNISKSECNSAAIQIHEVDQQRNRNIQAAQIDRDDMNQSFNNQPRTTYCNKIGNQMFCNTY
jgi:hypothetical protein